MAKKMKILKQNINKLSFIQRLILLLIVSIAVGFLWEVGYELNVQRKAAKGAGTPGLYYIENENIETENAKITNDGQIHLAPNDSFSIHFPERFVNKFRYSYNSDITFKMEIIVSGTNGYQYPFTEVIEDYSRPQLHNSVVNVSDYISAITVKYYPLNGESNSTLNNLVIDNSFCINYYRIFFVSIFVFLILFFAFSGDIFVQKLEIAFAVIATSIGILFISLQPMEPISWDEAVHIHSSFSLYEDPGIHNWKSGDYYLQENKEGLLPKSPHLSKEEKGEQKEYINSLPIESNKTYEKSEHYLEEVGYIFIGTGLKIGEWLGLSFHWQYLLGKFFNLISYIILITVAIKILPIGKQLMCVLALMPTPMFQAGVYTYDAVVTGFLFLGSAILVREFYWIDKKINWKTIVLFSVAMIIGCCPKAIYAPLIIIAAFLPKSKFNSLKGCYLYRTVIILLFLGMMSTFVLPALMSEGMDGDPRGGNTNAAEQLSLIFSHPIVYSKVLLNNFWDELMNFFVGPNNFAALAYAGVIKFHQLTGILAIGVALTQPKLSDSEDKRKKLQIFKLISVLGIFASIALIWTALYLSFTEVGQFTIAGVQGRYFIPLTFLLFLILGDVRLSNHIKEKTYNRVILSISTFMLFQMLYEPFFLQYCQ